MAAILRRQPTSPYLRRWAPLGHPNFRSGRPSSKSHEPVPIVLHDQRDGPTRQDRERPRRPRVQVIHFQNAGACPTWNRCERRGEARGSGARCRGSDREYPRNKLDSRVVAKVEMSAMNDVSERGARPGSPDADGHCAADLPNSRTRFAAFREYLGWNYFATLTLSPCPGMGIGIRGGVL